MNIRVYDENGIIQQSGGTGGGETPAPAEIVTVVTVPEGTFLGQVTLEPVGGFGLWAELTILANTDVVDDRDDLLVQPNGDTSTDRYAQTGIEKAWDTSLVELNQDGHAGIFLQGGAAGGDTPIAVSVKLTMSNGGVSGVRKVFQVSEVWSNPGSDPDTVPALREWGAAYTETDEITQLVLVSENAANFAPGSTFILKVIPVP